MWKTLLRCAVAAGSLDAATHAQDAKKGDDRRIMVVTGCIERSWIKLNSPTRLARTPTGSGCAGQEI